MCPNTRIILLLTGVILTGCGQSSKSADSGVAVSKQLEDLYNSFVKEPPNCGHLITAYRGAMFNGDGMLTREQDANYVQNILWYAKQRIIRKYPQSGWAQPEHLEEAAKLVFKSCQEMASGVNSSVDSQGHPDTIIETDDNNLNKIVDGLMQLSPYSEEELVH